MIKFIKDLIKIRNLLQERWFFELKRDYEEKQRRLYGLAETVIINGVVTTSATAETTTITYQNDQVRFVNGFFTVYCYINDDEIHDPKAVNSLHDLLDTIKSRKVKIDNKQKNKFTKEEEKLRNMMRDPKYWRDNDPDYAAQIRNGFNRLYGDK